MSHHPTPAPNQQPLSRGSISLWIGIALWVATAVVGVLAYIAKQNTIVAIITFLATVLSVPIGVLQVNRKLFIQARQTMRTGRLIFGIALLLTSLGLNAYLFFQSHTSRAPAGGVFLPAASRATIPTLTSTPLSLPALVKDNWNLKSDDYTTQINVAFPFSVTARNLIVVAITQWEGTVTNVTDTQGDSYIPLKVKKQYAQIINNVPHDYAELYYAPDVRGGATTVTVQFSTPGNNDNPNNMNVGIYEFSGLSTANLVNQPPVSSSGYTSTPDGGMLRSTKGHELYFVVGVDDDGNNTAPKAGSGYTLLHGQQDVSSNERFYAEDRIAGPGSFPVDFSIATSSYWVVIGASFKPA